MTPSPRRPLVRLVLASALLAGLWGCQRDQTSPEPVAVASVAAPDPEAVDEVVTMLVREAMRAPPVERSDGPGQPEAPARLVGDGPLPPHAVRGF